MASVAQVCGKNTIMGVLQSKSLMKEFKKAGINTLGLADEGMVYKVGEGNHYDGNCITVSITCKVRDYDGVQAVASYKNRIKEKIEILKSELEYYENLGV